MVSRGAVCVPGLVSLPVGATYRLPVAAVAEVVTPADSNASATPESRRRVFGAREFFVIKAISLN
jgi:hypothetical protein